MKTIARSLVVTVTLLAASAAALTVRVQPTPHGPQIHVNGKPIPPQFFFGVPRSRGISESPGPFFEQVALAQDAGVNFVSFVAPNCWTSPEQPLNWLALDDLCRQIIAVNSKALLVPRVSANAPDWWLQRHPEARMVYDTNQPACLASVSHGDYRTAAAAHLERLCRHLTATFPDHFAGVHPCGQNTGEWFYEGSGDRPLSGYDPATREAFRAWLQARGDADFATAEPPIADERRAHPNGFLRDPASEHLSAFPPGSLAAITDRAGFSHAATTARNEPSSRLPRLRAVRPGAASRTDQQNSHPPRSCTPRTPLVAS
ncbi:MAG: hypothetical protein WCT12_22300 [Verrucomicrobiota bacterium]